MASVYNYDRGDRIAAAMNLLFVAEDDGGIVEIHDMSQGGRLVGSFRTGYDRGDAIAAYNVLFLVAEDDGGVIQTYNRVKEWRPMDTFATHYDSGDGLGTYVISSGSDLDLVTCVAEDDGGIVECTSLPYRRFLY